MAAACKISRDINGELMEVYAPNKKPSILWHDLTDKLGDKELAYNNYVKSLTSTFQQKVKNFKNKVRDANGEVLLKDFLEIDTHQPKQKSANTPNNQATGFGSTAAIDFFNAQSANVSVDETDPNNSFYTDGKAKFQRLTEWVYNQFIKVKDKEYKDDQFDHLAKQEFVKKNTDIAEKIIYGKSTEPKTFEEVKNEIKQSIEKYRWIGKIVHKMIEGFLKHGDVNYFDADINEFSIKGNIEESEYAWFTDNKAEELIEKLDINTNNLNNTEADVRDNVASELMMVNEALGLGTANDGLVEHADGSVSFIDYKTGVRFLDDTYTLEKMAYNDGLSTKIVNSKVNKAMLELTIRMIMAKMNKPDLAVRRLQIAHMSRKQRISIKTAPVQLFLDYINNNMKISIREAEKINKKTPTPEMTAKIVQLKEQYKAMQEAKVFDFDNYRSQSKELAEDQFDLSDIETTTGQVEKVAKDIGKVVTKSMINSADKNNVFAPAINKLRNQIIFLLDSFKSAKQDSLSTELENESIRDITFLDKHLKGIRQQSNVFIQRFGAYFDNMDQKANKAINNATGEQSDLMIKDRALNKEYYERTGRKTLKMFSYAKDNAPVALNEQGLYDFMYQFRVVGDKTTRIGAVYTEEDFKAGKLTQAQWDYYKTVKALLKDRYEKIRNTVAYINERKYPVTYGQLYKEKGYNFDKWEETFLPQIPFGHIEEIIEKNIQTGNTSIKTITKDLIQSHEDRYNLVIQNEQKFKIGLPLKYMSNPFFADDNHSFNVTAAVTAFAAHMTQKEYMDDVYNVGLGTVNIMAKKLDERGKPMLENSVEYLQSYLDQHLLGRMKVTTEYSKDNDKLNKKIDNTVDNFGHFISMNAFWVNPIVAGWNYLFGQFTNAKEGLIGSLSKRLFGFENQVTTSSVARANKVWWGHEIDQLSKRGNLKRQFDKKFETLYYEDKVNFMMKEFRLNNKSYKFVDHSIMNAVHNRLFTKDSAMVFEGLSEDASNEVLVIAAMISKKIQVKKVENGAEVTYYLTKDGNLTLDKEAKNLQNMWDAYEWNDDTKAYEYGGEYNYQGAKSKTRFLDSFGQAVTGMNTQENLQIKTYLERMYGAYSPEQKTSLERYALGRAVLKFKKFQIMNLSENIGLNSDYNQNVGSYKAMFNADGTPKLQDGQQLYQWEAEVVKSRMVVLLSLIKNIATLKKTAFSDLTDEDKRQLSRMTMQLAFYLMILTACAAAIPPEDKDKQYATRLQRLAGDMLQISPSDMLNNLTTLDNYAVFAHDAVKNGGNLVMSIASGNEIKSGAYKGQYKGQHWMTTHIPLVSAGVKTKDFFGIKDEDKSDTKSMDSRIQR